MSTGRTMFSLSGVALIAAACAIHLFWVVFFDFTQDDAYITFRYAANFMSGQGLVYNAGERVEGYTNFLWTLMMILGGLAGIDFVLLSKLLGGGCGCVTIVLLYLVGIEVFTDGHRLSRPVLSGLCCLLCGAALSFGYWAGAGLETAAFGMMLTAAVYFYIRRSLAVAACLVVATLLRPEGSIILFVAILHELVTKRKITRYAILIFILSIVPLLPFAVFKWSYYGAVLPNSFYAKTEFSFGQVSYGLSYAGLFFWHYFAAGLFLLPALIAFGKSPRAARALMIFLMVFTVYIILIGGDVLKVHRFFVPVLGLMIVAAVGGISILLRGRTTVLAAALLLVWQSAAPYDHVATFHAAEKNLVGNMRDLSTALRAVDTRNFSVAASTIGMVGYCLPGHPVIDMLGLTDSAIARHPEPPAADMRTTWRESKYNSAYLLSRQPDYILFSTGIKPSAPAERALFSYSQFLKAYRTVPFYLSGKMYQAYKRYYQLVPPIEKDIHGDFGKYFAAGINLWRDKKPGDALTAFARARAVSPRPVYPYLLYFESLIYEEQGDHVRAYTALQQIVAGDTLVFEGYDGLYMYETGIGRGEEAQRHRDRMAALAPWYLPVLDRGGGGR